MNYPLFHFRHSERCVCFVSDRSLYREFLFLTLAAMGKDHVGKNECQDATDFCCCTTMFYNLNNKLTRCF